MGARSMESSLRQRQDPGHSHTFQNFPEPQPPYLPGQQENRGLEQGRGEEDCHRDGQMSQISFKKEKGPRAGAGRGRVCGAGGALPRS